MSTTLRMAEAQMLCGLGSSETSICVMPPGSVRSREGSRFRTAHVQKRIPLSARHQLLGGGGGQDGSGLARRGDIDENRESGVGTSKRGAVFVVGPTSVTGYPEAREKLVQDAQCVVFLCALMQLEKIVRRRKSGWSFKRQ